MPTNPDHPESNKEPAEEPQSSADPGPDPMEQAKRIMKRLAEMPHKPHEPIGKRFNKDAAATATPNAKERPPSKGRVHKGKTRR